MFRKKNNTTGEKKKKSVARRILKWSGITLLVLLIVVISLPFLFRDKIFEKVKTEINKNLNAKFECEDFSLSLIRSFPNFSLQLHDVKLSGVDEFEGVDLMKVEDMVFTIDLYSVLWGDQIDILEVGLKKPDIHVVVLDNGKANYDISKTDTTAVQPAPEDTAGQFDLQLREYYIEDGNIVYDDYSGNMFARIVNLNHSGKGDFTQDVFDFKTKTTADTIDLFMDGIPYMKNTKADLEVNLEMNLPESKYTFKENLLKMNELELGIDGWLAMPDTNMDMDISFDAKKTDFKNIISMVPAVYTKDFNDIKFNGKTAFNGTIKGRMNAASMPAMNIDLSVDNGSFQYPGLPKSATGIFVKASLNSKGDPTMDDMIIDVPLFKANFGGNIIDAFLNLRNPISDPGIKAGLVAKANLATLKDVLPMGEGEEYNGIVDADVKINGRMSALDRGDYESFKASGKILAKDVNYKSPDMSSVTEIKIMEFNFSPQQLELASFEALLDKSHIMAHGSMSNYLAYFLRDETLKGNFEVSSPQINLGDFMSEEATPAQATPPTTGEAAAATSEMSVFEVPGNINFNLITRIGRIIYPNDPGRPEIILDQVNGGVSLNENVMSLDNLSFKTLDAGIKMNGSYDTKNVREPDVKFKIDIADMDIKKAAQTFNSFEKLAPIGSRCTGKFSTNLNLNTKLNDKMEVVYETLSGNGTLTTKNIFIEGLEPVNRLAEKLKISRLAKQNIQDVTLAYKFQDGRVYVEPYEVKLGGNYKATVTGSTGFDQTIDYKMNISIPRSEFGPANAALDEMMKKAGQSTGTEIKMSDLVNVAVKVTGTVADPKIETNYQEQLTDLKEEIKEQLKEKVEEKIEEVKEDLKGKANEEARKIIKEAEEKAAQVRAEAKKAADKVRAEAKAAGDKLITEAGNNPLKKVAAEKSAEKLNKEADEKARKIEKEADDQATKIVNEAQAKADALK